MPELMLPKVFNKRSKNAMPPNSVYVGRPTMFGNPFSAPYDGTRKEVIEKFEQHLRSRPDLVAYIRRELRGKHLVCWCAPLPCHADVLLKVANMPDLREVIARYEPMPPEDWSIVLPEPIL